MLAHSVPFNPEDRTGSLSSLPESPAVFALCAADRADGTLTEPYLGKTPNLRRRLQRFLSPAPSQSKRLELSRYVRRIEYTPTGSDFESDLVFYNASLTVHGAAARKRLRLRPPAFLRMSTANAFPRLYVTNKLARSAAGSTFGPFPTRTAAERYTEAVLDLFQLRRCFEDLEPYPEHPACAYAEMKKCLAPCNQSSTPERYGEETTAVFEFLRTHGASLLAKLDAERTAASDALDFETAATVHQRFAKAEAVAAQGSEAVRLLSELAAIIVQPASDPYQVSLFSLARGLLAGPVPYSTAGMRLHNEQSGSSSLFSHPVAIEAVPLEAAQATSASTLEDRLSAALGVLAQADRPPSCTQETEDHLALFSRWYYRPQARRVGEAIFADANGSFPHKALLRAISRVARQGPIAQSPSEPA